MDPHHTRVIEPGKRFLVGPGGQIDIFDVFDFVEALIEEKGWNPGKDASGNIAESSDSVGYTLHAAIGEFGTRLATGGTLTGRKDATYYDPDSEETVSLRVGATYWVEEAIKETGLTAVPADSGASTLDQYFNDQAQGVDEVMAVVSRARELATAAPRSAQPWREE